MPARSSRRAGALRRRSPTRIRWWRPRAGTLDRVAHREELSARDREEEDEDVSYRPDWGWPRIWSDENDRRRRRAAGRCAGGIPARGTAAMAGLSRRRTHAKPSPTETGAEAGRPGCAAGHPEPARAPRSAARGAGAARARTPAAARAGYMRGRNPRREAGLREPVRGAAASSRGRILRMAGEAARRSLRVARWPTASRWRWRGLGGLARDGRDDFGDLPIVTTDANASMRDAQRIRDPAG